MSQDLTEKYRPRTLNDVVGNPKAVSELKAWAESWDKGIPRYRAAILMGSPGIGKTTCAEALANDMGWGLLEMNASDQRTGDAIRSVALRGAYSNTFSDGGDYLNASEGGRKLIILDEADSLFGNADRGALPAIAELIKQTRQPVILIVNDFYALSKKSSVIKTETLQLNFLKPSAVTIIKVLKRICAAEGIDTNDETLKRIAENANGDMRAAVRDLESLTIGRKELVFDDAEYISGRNVRKTMYDLMGSIFRKSDAMGSRAMLRDVDEEPSYVLLWLDENMPYEYTDRGDLVRGYEKLSRADIFLGRVNRRQYYGMWSYATDTMTAGVCTARRTNNISRERFKFPGYMMKLSRSKSIRATKASVCQKLADMLHTSTKRVSMDVIPPLKNMLNNDPELRVGLVKEADLDAEELAFLMDMKVDSKAVKEAIAAANEVPETPAKPTVKKKEITEEPAQPVETTEVKAPSKKQRSLFDF